MPNGAAEPDGTVEVFSLGKEGGRFGSNPSKHHLFKMIARAMLISLDYMQSKNTHFAFSVFLLIHVICKQRG